MKKNHFLCFGLLFLVCQFAALVTYAQVNQPVIAFVTIQSAKSGTIKGGSMQRETEGQIECIGFSYTVKSPRDAASGLPSGKRVEGAITITKHLDISTPQLLQMLYTNESLKSVKIDFYKRSATGMLTLFQAIQLTNATISEVSQYGGTLSPDKLIPNSLVNENVSFTFQKIEFSNIEGKTTAADNWMQ